jgi:myosin heavy subunit
MKISLSFLGELSQGNAKAAEGADSDNVAAKLMSTNPVMEALGNAKTIRNNNSSRFGKHFDIQFAEDGAILGAFTSTYLLEKPRICMHMKGERNYHVFYMLCKASEEIREPVQCEQWQNYFILKQDGTVATVTTWNDDAEFKDMHAALLKLGFNQTQRNECYMLLSCCQWVGNIKFKEGGGGDAEITNMDIVNKTAEMMQCPPADLAKAMISKTMGGGVVEVYTKPLEPKQAESSRNSLCMHLYQLVFDWCTDKINIEIAVNSADFCVGLLDIFGFENFGTNSFPQLCINFTNESLHNLFIEHVFKLEQETCAP